MKKLTLLLLGFLLAACSWLPTQVVEQPGASPAQTTPSPEQNEPQPTATVAPTSTPTAPATPTSIVLPTQPRAPTWTPTETPDLSTPTPSVYMVQAGDTLAQIADRFQVSVEAIAAQNEIEDVNQIAVGQVLEIPVGAAGSQPPPAPERAGMNTPLPPQTIPPEEGAPDVEKSWPGICHPSPAEEGVRVADLPIGESLELTGYLHVMSSVFVSDNRYTFRLRPAPHQDYDPETWYDQCWIYVRIPRDKEGKPNHVRDYGTSFASVVILDMKGRDIRGWTGVRDSRPVRIVGTVVKPYARATELDGSNTIDVVEIELLEGS